ncbi:hypothetical protein JTE90_008388 [Oedothorax gibbosus]|uniref:Uncharacterized protein n=1 Tax=Oedothorax gibbosus TaxID=931172 RepID=A0AAV6V3K7_9ARAC|nr:hypothetical protein JTE90_008388 [Oedothorax gibbosus]
MPVIEELPYPRRSKICLVGGMPKQGSHFLSLTRSQTPPFYFRPLEEQGGHSSQGNHQERKKKLIKKSAPRGKAVALVSRLGQVISFTTLVRLMNVLSLICLPPSTMSDIGQQESIKDSNSLAIADLATSNLREMISKHSNPVDSSSRPGMGG